MDLAHVALIADTLDVDFIYELDLVVHFQREISALHVVLLEVGDFLQI